MSEREEGLDPNDLNEDREDELDTGSIEDDDDLADDDEDDDFEEDDEEYLDEDEQDASE